MSEKKLISKNPPPKRYKVGEISQHTNLSRQTIHNYTTLGLISPVGRTPSGHRLYGEEVFARLRQIELLKRHHTMAEIPEKMAEFEADEN